jgi:hypothetical protein
MHPTLIIQEMQTIKCIKATKHQLQLSSLSYLRGDCRKPAILISESRGDSNRCTPCRGKLNQHATCIPRSVRVWSQTIRFSRDQRIAIFHEVINGFVQIHCPWEEGLLTQSTARRPFDPWVRTQLLSHNSQWGNGEKTSWCCQPATRLTRPISPACDRYVQYLLAGANTSVLNRHRRGLQPWRHRLSTYHSPTFPTDSLSFPPMGPAWSPVYPSSIN